MKQLMKTGMLIAIGGFVLALAGCEGNQGPAGPPGTAECTKSCHTDDYQTTNYIRTRQTEYAQSQHNLGDTFERRGVPCSRCHTTEGYQHYLQTGQAVTVTESTPVGCFACHAPHTNENFSLRKQGATTLERGGTYDKGESNTCAMCHQARTPDPDFADNANVTSKYWGPHHGPQASILNGSGAYVFPGSSYDSNHPHNTSISTGCVNCHMAEVSASGLAGGHTYKMAYLYHGQEKINSKGCVGCHATWDDGKALTEVDGLKGSFESDLATLRADLVTLGWIDDTDHIVPGDTYTADDLGAVYNFLLLLEDRSGSVHNPVYANAVLSATQTYVTSRMAE